MNPNSKIFIIFLVTCLSHASLAREGFTYRVPQFHFDWSKPSPYPDRIVVSFGEDPSMEASVT